MNKYINHRGLLEILELAKEEVLQKGIRTEDKLLMLYGLNYAIITVENTLPADVQPVRHGRWIPEDEYYVDDTYICSACGYEFIITAGDLESNELNYCPRCGAKMDGGKS